MPALDTNVLVRYLVRDDGAQLAAAKRLIEACIAADQALFVPVTVTLELEWVLRASYELGKDEVTQVLASLLAAAELTFESEHALEIALQLYREGPADFADCLHVALAEQAGQAPLYTFDKRAAKVQGAQAVGGSGR
ncbi:PIN domain-containing protein [Ramlibacter rhizophilus]|uniref:Ribonuclease VapC n=1 Tax=Ramlibacter rhizophilus TaxID=1781167 RepID=A0A4Z0BRG9_9BURK|nr:type II toxin-antitoxin system VapC family toxin [Ramlibacter rhizophilus]TFZ01054.1 PIN domain-containing protein [Ramlibacter rhizophilus]